MLVRSLSVVLAAVALAAPLRAEAPSAHALSVLRAGNDRFSHGAPRHPHETRRRLRETVRYGQHPVAAVLGCADSRVSPEIVFDQGIGDLFDVRVAGNVANEDEIASLEYAVEHLHTPLIVVLGHSRCGAVTAVVNGDKFPGPNLPHLTRHLREAVDASRRAHPQDTAARRIAHAVEANVREAIADLLRDSDVLREASRHGHVRVVGAVYDLESGRVTWLP